MTFPTIEQKQMIHDVEISEEQDGLLMSGPVVQRLCQHFKALLAENERIREGVRYWSYCMNAGMRKECPEKVEELMDFLISLHIAPYSTRKK